MSDVFFFCYFVLNCHANKLLLLLLLLLLESSRRSSVTWTRVNAPSWSRCWVSPPPASRTSQGSATSWPTVSWRFQTSSPSRWDHAACLSRSDPTSIVRYESYWTWDSNACLSVRWRAPSSASPRNPTVCALPVTIRTGTFSQWAMRTSRRRSRRLWARSLYDYLSRRG